LAAIFREDQLKRYNRHILLPNVGEKGQRKLLEASVLLCGAGGLGSPCSLYLAAAGVGKIGVADFDIVDLSNLQRQIMHHGHDIGRPKVVSAAETIADINPDVKVVQHQVKLIPETIMGLISGYDLVIDCSDNFPTRYLINDACVLLKKPNVYGSVFMFEGQASLFIPGDGCYRCLFPSPPSPGLMPSSRTVGIMGVVPGVIGLIQATEAIKLILGIGENLANWLLIYDALAMDFRKVKWKRNPACPVCGNNPRITRLQDIDYEGSGSIVP
jgi:molybdopterin/thiamine biosynthesis adenylyltransferase